MAVNYTANVKAGRMQVVVDQIDAGPGPGVLEIGSVGFSEVLATIVLADPCGTVTGNTLSFVTPRSDNSAAGSGTAVEARLRDSNGNDVVTGLTVGVSGSGSDITLDSVSITPGQTVSINTASLIHG